MRRTLLRNSGSSKARSEFAGQVLSMPRLTVLALDACSKIFAKCHELFTWNEPAQSRVRVGEPQPKEMQAGGWCCGGEQVHCTRSSLPAIGVHQLSLALCSFEVEGVMDVAGDPDWRFSTAASV